MKLMLSSNTLSLAIHLRLSLATLGHATEVMWHGSLRAQPSSLVSSGTSWNKSPTNP